MYNHTNILSKSIQQNRIDVINTKTSKDFIAKIIKKSSSSTSKS